MMVQTFAGTANADWFIDDIAVNKGPASTGSSLHASFPNPGAVRSLAFPTAEGSLIELTPSTGTDNAANVNEWPNTTGVGADYNTTVAVAATSTDKYYHTTTATLGVTGTVTAVQVLTAEQEATGFDSPNHNLGLCDSGGNFHERTIVLVAGGSSTIR